MFNRGASYATDLVNSISEYIGRLTAWLVVVMVSLTLYDVGMRYLFDSGSVALQELEWHLFAIIILFGASYTFKHDGHVRVDLFYQSRFVSERGRLLIDVFGNLLFLLPFASLIVWASLPFAFDAFSRGEISPDPGGLSQRWLLKSTIPIGFALLALQALADTAKKLLELRRGAA